MKIIAIVTNTCREAIRDKVLYSLVFFAFLMFGIGSILNRITIGQTDKIIKDIGLASISIFGVLIAIFVGIGLVFKEIDKRTIYSIIAKPIERWHFLLGKYLGLILTLFVETFVMTLGLYFFILIFSEKAASISLIKAILLIFTELTVVTSIAVLFSSFSTPFLSGIFTLALFLICHMTEDLKEFSTKLGASEQHIINFLYRVLPNLEILNIKGRVVHDIPVSWSEVFFGMTYGAMYVMVFMALSILIFQKREFR